MKFFFNDVFKNRVSLSTGVLLLSLSLILSAGCSSAKKKETSSDTEITTDAPMDDVDTSTGSAKYGDSDSGTAGELRTVNFPYDSSQLNRETQAILDRNAEFLKNNPTSTVQIEGHCDERGGIQYNLALGEKRAKAVRDYLMALGVDSSRMSVVSYGKERPLIVGSDEISWSQNRRANFVFTGN